MDRQGYRDQRQLYLTKSTQPAARVFYSVDNNSLFFGIAIASYTAKMSERQVNNIVQIGHRWVGSVSSSASKDGSSKPKGWFCDGDLKVNKSKSEPKPQPLKDHMLHRRKPETVNQIKADVQSQEAKTGKADLKIEEIKADLKPHEVAECKAEPKPENVEEINEDLKPNKVVESTGQIEENKPHTKPEELEDGKPEETEEIKPDVDTGEVKKDPHVKENNADFNVKVAEDQKSGDPQKKRGVFTRTLRWFTFRKEKHMAKRKEKKAAKKAKKEEAKSAEADPRIKEEEMWAEILKLESEISSHQDDQEVAEAEWRHLMVAKVRRTKYLEKLKKDRVHSAELEEELCKVLWAQMDLEEKSLTLKQRLRLKFVSEFC